MKGVKSSILGQKASLHELMECDDKKNYKNKEEKVSIKKLTQTHIDLFKKSNIFNPIFENATFSFKPDNIGRYSITLVKGEAWECKTCNKKHTKNSNRPFLYFAETGILWYSCRGKGTSVPVTTAMVNVKFSLEKANEI